MALIVGECATFMDEAPSGSAIRARPKSSTFTFPSNVTWMLAGFRSRWTMPFSCAASSASAIWLCELQRIVNRDPCRVLGDPCGERLALHQLHHQEVAAVDLFDPVQGGDVGMVQRRERLRLALEPQRPLAIGHEGFEHQLEGHVAFEPSVARPVDFTHAPGTEQIDDFIRTKLCTDAQRHRRDVPWDRSRRMTSYGHGREPGWIGML